MHGEGEWVDHRRSEYCARYSVDRKGHRGTPATMVVDDHLASKRAGRHVVNAHYMLLGLLLRGADGDLSVRLARVGV